MSKKVLPPVIHHRIVTDRPRPLLRAAVAGGIGVLLALGGAGAYALMRSQTFTDFRQASTELQQLRDERRALARELRAERASTAELRQRLVYAERSSDIDGQACSTVKESLAGLQAEAADLREQVAFYRGIVSPDEAKAGVRVLDLHVSAQPADPQRLRYDLVLIQSVRHEKRVAGSLRIRVLGSQDGQPLTLDLEKQLIDAAKLPGFSFKYFQEFGGEFRLPAGFHPSRVAVTLVTDGEGSTQVEEEYDWSKIRKEKAPS